MFRYDPRTEQITQFQHDPGDPGSISENKVIKLLVDQAGILWVSTFGGDLNRFNPDTEEFIRSRHDPMDISSLGAGTITVLYEDQAGSLWVGSAGGGISVLHRQRTVFSHLIKTPADTNSLNGENVRAITQDRRGYLWIGTTNGGVSRLDPETGIFTHFSHDPDDPYSLSDNSVYAIYEDRAGTLWVGTYLGLNRLNGGNGTWSHYIHDPDNPVSLSYNQVHSIAEDSEGTFWVGTGNGLNRLDRNTGQFTRYFHDPADSQSLSDNNVAKLVVGRDNTLWVGTSSGGLNRLDPETGAWTHYYYDPEDPVSLSGNSVYAISEDSLGRLWVGTAKGLNLLDRDTGHSVRYTRSDGLASDIIYGIQDVPNGNGLDLWICTSDGLSRFSPDTGEFTNFNTSDGLVNKGFTWFTAQFLRNDELWIGGPQGIDIVDITRVITNSYTPPVVLTSFEVNNHPVTISDDSLLKQSITSIDKLTLSHEDHVISFEFAALNFINPEKNQYAYMLEGFDEDWITNSGNRRRATYTNLDAGQYNFLVKGSNNNGLWNEEGLSLSITIIPPWWETWWFRSLTAAAVLAVFGYIYLTKVNQLRSEKRAATAVRESEEKYRVLFESFPMGITVTDPAGKVLEANLISETLLGISTDEHTGRGIDGEEWRIVRSDGTTMLPDEYASVIALKENRLVENMEMGIIKPDKTNTWLSVTAAPIPLEKYGVVISYKDITQSKQAERKLELTLEEKETLLQELYHRTKNNMQVIIGFIELQAIRVNDENIKEIFRDTKNRILSMSLVHQKLYQSKNLFSINLADYIKDLAAALLGSYLVDPDRTSLVLELETINVTIDTAIPCGLIINELLSNSIKHAYPGGSKGVIKISLKCLDNNNFNLIVSDDGIGFPEGMDPRTCNSIGLKTIFSLAEKQLKGKLTCISSKGVFWELKYREELN